MPLMNSMGALKQQKVGSVVPSSYNYFLSSIDFNLTTDTNNYGIKTVNNIPMVYGQSYYSSTYYAFLCLLNPSNGSISKSIVLTNGTTSTTIQGVVVDSLGNYHVLQVNSSNVCNFIKYDSNWNYITNKAWNVTFVSGSGPYNFSIDSSDNLYVTGGLSGLTVLKINSSYNVIYLKTINIPNPNYSNLVDGSQNVYVLSSDTSGYTNLLKLDSTGSSILWQKRFSHNTFSDNQMCIDSSNNIYVLTSDGTNSPATMYINKFDTNGTKLFSKALSDSSAFSFTAINIFFNSSNVLTVQAYFGNSLYVYTLDNSGNLLTQNVIDGLPSNSQGGGNSGTGKIYMGYLDTSYSNYTPITILQLPLNGNVGTSTSYSYTYKSNVYSGTLIPSTTTTASISTISISWTNTSYTLSNGAQTTTTPTITLAGVTPFNYYQSL